MSRNEVRAALHFTSDLHGRVSPFDPFTGAVFPGGLARAATLLHGLRRQTPEAILLDLGDLVQGTPFGYLPIVTRAPDAHPMIRALNALGCDGLVVGNHEFNYGWQWVQDARRASRFPWLAANVVNSAGVPVFEPVLRFERGGKKIAILALTTPQVPRWEVPRNIEGLKFLDAVETAAEWVPRLRREADAVVVAAHMGWAGVTDGGVEVPQPPENDVERLTRLVPGIDAVIMAHTHESTVRRGELGATTVQAAWGGLAVGEVVLTWSDGNLHPHAGARIISTDATTEPDAAVVAGIESDEEKAMAWVSTVIGEATSPITTEGARYRDNGVLSLIHRAQQSFAQTDLSSAALFYADRPIAEGPVRVLDVYRIYPFENYLTIVELTAGDVREYLEEIARIYITPGDEGSLPGIDPRISLSNHDSVAGAEYVLDPGRPVGQRVLDLTFDGEEWPDDRRVTMALSSYRACGGGGYRSLRRARILDFTRVEIRTLLTDYVNSRRQISPEIHDNWRVIGAPLGVA